MHRFTSLSRVVLLALGVWCAAAVLPAPSVAAEPSPVEGNGLGSFLRGAACGYSIGAAVVTGGLLAGQAIVVCTLAFLLSDSSE